MNGAANSLLGTRQAERRARDLIADRIAALACEDGSGVAHVPALYCPEVVAAIERRGVACLPYDFGWPARARWTDGDALGSSTRGVLLWFHPFGYRHPLPEGSAMTHRILVDGCHALRTAMADPRLFDRASVTVFSPRKEFGLEAGGIALGVGGHENGNWHPMLPIDPDRMCEAGWRATRKAAESLPGYIPPPGARDILTHLPLRSDRRDAAIERLRGGGVPAWRWLERWTADRPHATPRADRLADELLLVPIALEENELARAIATIRQNISMFKPVHSDLSSVEIRHAS